MINEQKPVVMLTEQSVTNGGTATARVDTLGYKFLTLVLNFSTADSTSHSLSTVKLGRGGCHEFDLGHRHHEVRRRRRGWIHGPGGRHGEPPVVPV